jgi:hypothetical protein
MRFKRAQNAADEIQAWHDEGYEIFHLGNAKSAANGRLMQNYSANWKRESCACEFQS